MVICLVARIDRVKGCLFWLVSSFLGETRDLIRGFWDDFWVVGNVNERMTKV